MLFLLFVFMLFVGLAGLAILTTVGVTLASLVTLVTAPGQLWRLLRDRTLRRNHALEHATVNVIEERYGRSHLAGLAKPEGFVIQGGAPPALVADAAQEALARLQAGERRLAIHPRCGTTLVAAQLVMALAFLATLVIIQQFTLLPFLVGIVAAVLLGPRLSPILQRYVTTDADVGDLMITGVEVQPVTTSGGFLSLLTLGPVLVRTAPASGGPSSTEATLITGDREEIPIGDFRVR
ncbi:DUF6391 domain-containing protein [Sphaerobacter sp.]|uniref:DUF6391 domain-containing protein n=1 Tax=Sphaerobacter sp. TaxID=2099654 RepID=UPI001E10845C|nr:DUF6391 domain-containing protein [Sphaerobacter sp.]MBX5444880.1 hypothetical protein [Sphaerobacter sp.]